jgi:hypothetical protein
LSWKHIQVFIVTGEEVWGLKFISLFRRKFSCVEVWADHSEFSNKLEKSQTPSNIDNNIKFSTMLEDVVTHWHAKVCCEAFTSQRTICDVS